MWRTVLNCLQTRIAFSCLIDTRYFAAIDRSLLKRLRSFVRATRAFISVAAAATKVLQRFVRFFRPFYKFSESLPSWISFKYKTWSKQDSVTATTTTAAGAATAATARTTTATSRISSAATKAPTTTTTTMWILEHLTYTTWLEVIVYICVYRLLFASIAGHLTNPFTMMRWSHAMTMIPGKGTAFGIANLIVSALFGLFASLSGFGILHFRSGNRDTSGY